MLRKLTDHYVVASVRDDRYHQLCSVYDLLQADIDKDKRAQEIYQEIKRNYPPGTTELFIHPEPSKIQGKIMDIVNFTLDKVMKVDELEVIYRDRQGSSLPVLITEILQTNFRVTEETIVDQTYRVKIRKR